MKLLKWFWVVLAGTLLFPGSSVHATVDTVLIASFNFNPDTVTINQGDTVLWRNTAGISHTSTSGPNCVANPIWNSGLISPGGTFSRPFSAVGIFPYFCAVGVHCSSFRMEGVVIVQGVGVEEGSKTRKQNSLFEILQNHPNPFSSFTEIRYSLFERSLVKLDVYDIVGRRVRTLVHSEEEGGQKVVVWEGLDERGQRVKPGIYFVRFETENFKSVRKIITIR